MPRNHFPELGVELLEHIRTGDLHDGLLTQLIDDYVSNYDFTPAAETAIARCLLSPLRGVRNMALEALTQYGDRTGYEGEAVLLYFESREEHWSRAKDAIRSLKVMMENGSRVAARILYVLSDNPDNLEMLGSLLPYRPELPTTQELQAHLSKFLG
jgi:hypothetical protein